MKKVESFLDIAEAVIRFKKQNDVSEARLAFVCQPKQREKIFSDMLDYSISHSYFTYKELDQRGFYEVEFLNIKFFLF